MPVGQLVALRNKKNGVTVLTPDRSDPRNYLEFQAAGDPSGGDVQYVSEELAASSAAVKAILHGVLELEEDTMSPAVAQAFQQQMQVAKRQREQAEAQIAATIERTENTDIVGESCVGPGERADKPCGASVPMREKALRDTPPLCVRHQPLAGEYVPTVDWDGDKQVTKWFRSGMAERERAVQ